MGLPNIIQQVNSKLPLSGGTITGSITFLNNWGDNVGDIGGCISTNNNCLRLTGGEGAYDKAGGVIQLFNRMHTANAGGVVIRADNGTTSKEINLKSDGTFTWGGNNVITSEGGLFTGKLTWEHGIIRDQGNNFEFIGDKDNINNCSFISCRSVYNSKEPGWFLFGARTQEQSSIGICKPEGTFTWRGINHTQWMMPDYNKTSPTSLPTYPISSKAIFTAPFDGWLFIHANRTTAGNTLHLQFNSSSCIRQFPAFSTEYCDIFHPMKKGDYVHVWTDNYNNANTWVITNQIFYGCKGNP